MLEPISGGPTGPLTQTPPGGRDDPDKLKQVAAEFESLLLAQMLKSIREASSGGWLSGGGDAAGVTMVELAEQEFARILASQGGFGLADLLRQGVSSEP
jgi:flagellar protein FlgJ